MWFEHVKKNVIKILIEKKIVSFLICKKTNNKKKLAFNWFNNVARLCNPCNQTMTNLLLLLYLSIWKF